MMLNQLGKVTGTKLVRNGPNSINCIRVLPVEIKQNDYIKVKHGQVKEVVVFGLHKSEQSGSDYIVFAQII